MQGVRKILPSQHVIAVERKDYVECACGRYFPSEVTHDAHRAQQARSVPLKVYRDRRERGIETFNTTPILQENTP